jgi:hypothetical protein
MTMTESQDALAHLAWQVELGADEAILDAPVNRFERPREAARSPPRSLRLCGTEGRSRPRRRARLTRPEAAAAVAQAEGSG